MIARALTIGVVAGLVFACRPASAEENSSSAPPRRWQAVSLSVPALSVRSLGLAYEHTGLVHPQLSVVGLVGVRRAATGDYASTTLTAGVEARYWLTGWAPWTAFRTMAPIGAFVGLRVAFGRTQVQDERDDESLGSILVFTETAELGYRFVALRHLEITPSLGVQLRHDLPIGSRLPSWTQAAFTGGLTLGYLF